MSFLGGDTVKKYEEKNDMTQYLSVGISDAALARFKRFCRDNFGTEVDEVPSEEGIFMKQSLSIVFYATFLFLLTNGIYLSKSDYENHDRHRHGAALYDDRVLAFHDAVSDFL